MNANECIAGEYRASAARCGNLIDATGQPETRGRSRGFVQQTGNAVPAAILVMLLAVPVLAVSTYPTRTVDAGGRQAGSAHYESMGSIGGMVGTASAGVPSRVNRGGFVAQLTEVTNLVITSSPSSINEGSTAQLGGVASLDDGTIAVVSGSLMIWSGPVPPIDSINSSGLATAGLVPGDTSAVVTGAYLGVYGTGAVIVVMLSPPVIVDPGVLVGTSGQAMTFQVTSWHLHGTPPDTLTILGLPSGATFNSSPSGTNRTGTFTWNPAGSVNTYPVRLNATAYGKSTSLLTRIYIKTPAEPLNGQGVPVSQTNWSPTTVAGGLNGGTLGLTNISGTGIGYELWSSRGPVTPTMTWARVVNETTAGGNLLNFMVNDTGTDTFYQVVLAGDSPVINSNIFAILHPVAKPGYQLAAPPLVTDRRFDGTFGAELAENLTGDNGGVNGAGDKVMIYETGGPNWRTLYLDASKVWRESNGDASTYQLASGQGFYLLRNQVNAATNAIAGRVGNNGTASAAIATGYNIVTVSEGRPVAIGAAFANTTGGTPYGDYDFALADEVFIQNANGSWKRLVRLPDGTWLDTQTGATASVTLQPGQAYYYSRKAGAMSVTF